MLMERNLELTDNSAKEDDGSNASIYSTHFLIDFLPPTKKGQRECLPLLVKVNTTPHSTSAFCLFLCAPV